MYYSLRETLKNSNFINGLLAIVIAMICTAPAMAEDGITPEQVADPVAWGAAEKVTQLKHLYFSGQPDDAAFAAAKANGVTTVINLRAPDELDWDEAAAAKAAGIEYINIPVIRDTGDLDRESMSKISAAVTAQNGAPVLLHCGRGQRATAWLAVHLVEDHKMDEELAMAVAEKAGLTSPGMQRRVSTYLDETE